MSEHNKEGFAKRAQHTVENRLNFAVRSMSAIRVKKQKLGTLEQENADLLDQNDKLLSEKAEQLARIAELEKLIADKEAEQKKQSAGFADEKIDLLAKIASLEKQIVDLESKNEELNQEHANEKVRFENKIATLSKQNEQDQVELTQAQSKLATLSGEKKSVEMDLEAEKQMRAELHKKYDAEHARVLSLEAKLLKVESQLVEERKKNKELGKQVEELKIGMNSEDLLRKAYSILMQGRYDEAIELYHRAIEAEKAGRNDAWELGSLWYSIYFCHFNSNRFDKALEALNHSIECRPEFPGNLYLRAKMYQELGRRSEAIEDLNKILVLKPDFCQAKDLLSELEFSR